MVKKSMKMKFDFGPNFFRGSSRMQFSPEFWFYDAYSPIG
jgi:hypothetical protein